MFLESTFWLADKAMVQLTLSMQHWVMSQSTAPQSIVTYNSFQYPDQCTFINADWFYRMQVNKYRFRQVPMIDEPA